MKTPLISFIIPTLNASEFLPMCLQAIRSQIYPQSKIEIVIADGGSTDNTLEIAKLFNARVIINHEVLHEPGKAIASENAHGDILFFTDADNILTSAYWVKDMVKAHLENPNVTGFLPQTVPPEKWNSFDRYMGYLSTDPFTWFIYRWASTPRTYGKLYLPIKETIDYKIYRFPVMNHPLLGLSQGFGTAASFKRGKLGRNDDILSGIKLISEGGLIAYVHTCGVYHYHVKNLTQFVHKYTWRIRNNMKQKVQGMGLVNRQKYLNTARKFRQVLFPIYSLSLIGPIIDTMLLLKIYRDPVLIWHPFACILLSVLIVKEVVRDTIGIKSDIGRY